MADNLISFDNDLRDISKRVWFVLSEVNGALNYNIRKFSELLECSESELMDLERYILSECINFENNSSQDSKSKESIFETIRRNLKSLSISGEIPKIFKLKLEGELREIKNDKEFTKDKAKTIYHSDQFLSKISDVFGVRIEWLKYKNETPFGIDHESVYYAEEMQNYLMQNKSQIQRIYLVLTHDIERAEFYIVVQLSEHKFLYTLKTWDIGDHVGRTGQKQIYSLYKLLKWLGKTGLESKSFGYITDKETFDNLRCGEFYPKKYLPNGISGCHGQYWIDDFVDIEGNYANADKYGETYGKWFVDGQKIIKFVKDDLKLP